VPRKKCETFHLIKVGPRMNDQWSAHSRYSVGNVASSAALRCCHHSVLN
jgi:hypothetical protein